ncbi:MAG TPA: hypothetical protein VHM92_10460 [Allosphingosinicella sp.]|nr:hypothetical protein [Allosphingosinicella sp.]
MFNKLVANIGRQRPSLFNYGTTSFVAMPHLMCHPIAVATGLPTNQPRVTLEPPIPVPGTAGAWAMEFCAQLTKLAIDFHPGQLFNLPPELNPPLAAQTLAIGLEVCGAIACPSPKLLAELGAAEGDRYPPIDPLHAIRGEKSRQDPPVRPPQTLPIDREHIHCFCLEVFATARVRHETASGSPVLAAVLKGLEIVDIRPQGLENSLECLLVATLTLGVLPRIRVALDDAILSLGSFGSLDIGLTPISAAVPFNPSIANDRLSVFVNVTLH